MKKCIVSIIDKSSTFDFTMMIYSLLRNNSGIESKFELVLFVIDEYENKFKAIIDILWKNYKIMTIPSELQKNIEYEGNRDWCNVNNKYKAHYRYAIFLLQEYEYIIYLDNDLLIKNTICELLNTKSEKIHVVKKRPNRISSRYPIKEGEEKIFNAGVMGIQKKYLNRKTMSDLMELQKQKKTSGNQAVLNEYFESEVHFLDDKLTLFTGFEPS